ncbi:unnamed protein product [Phytophthora fragariaefolia]|uniref:Unnamed protein product n=1 Tax=Phytophthora fragariaefolia TaxID=1490495 RepID=A0A9W6WVJ1_9STRA|nr:unnamed protein product [Phytophthora fragariaefolia]
MADGQAPDANSKTRMDEAARPEIVTSPEPTPKAAQAKINNNKVIDGKNDRSEGFEIRRGRTDARGAKTYSATSTRFDEGGGSRDNRSPGAQQAGAAIHEDRNVSRHGVRTDVWADIDQGVIRLASRVTPGPLGGGLQRGARFRVGGPLKRTPQVRAGSSVVLVVEASTRSEPMSSRVPVVRGPESSFVRDDFTATKF